MYGGTKTEMQRLVADAAKVDKSIDANSLSFGNIVAAINVVQKEMGIYGTTALEAEKTISGSLNAMKGAWNNLITGIADDNADFDVLINNMVESVGTFAGNILPRVEVALNGIVGLIEGVVPKILEKLPQIAESVLPNLVGGIEKLLGTVATLLPSLVDVALNTLAPSLLSGIETIAKVLLQNLPLVLETLSSGIKTLTPLIIETVTLLVEEIANVLPELTSIFANVLPDFYAAFIPAVIESLPSLLLSLFKMLPSMLVSALIASNPVALLFSAIIGLIKTYWEDIKTFFSETIPQLITDIVAWFQELPYKIGVIIGEVIAFFRDLPGNVKTWLVETIETINEWITNTRSTIIKKIPEVISKLVGFFKDLPSKIKEIGKNIVEGLWQGIQNAWSWLTNKVGGLFGELVGGIKDGLGIHSPSRVFRDQIGKQMALGLGIGWEEEFANVEDAIDNDLNFDDVDYGIATSTTSIGDFGGSSSSYGYGGSQNVNVTVGIDDSANAMGLARALLPFLKIAEKEVYA